MADALLGGIVINELLIDPSGAVHFDTDRNGVARSGDEFIELLNTSQSVIDISGLELWDAQRDNWFTFPPGSILEPGARATIVRNVQNGGSLPSGGADDLVFDADFSRGVFNNSGDNVVLYDPSNDEFIQATYNGDVLDDPTSGPGYAGFSSTASRVGAGEDFGSDIDGFSIQRFVDGSDNFSNDQTPTPSASNICFTSGTFIETPSGPHPVERLVAGNAVQTHAVGQNGEAQTDNVRMLVKVLRSRVGRKQLEMNPKLLPVRITAGALGNDLPRRDLLVSRQHRMLVSSKIAERMFGVFEVLVAAIRLTQLPGIYVDFDVESVDYFHLLFEKHEIIMAEGAPTESFFVGPESLRALHRDAKLEVLDCFPELRTHSPMTLPVRPIPTGHRQKRLVDRHRKNAKAILHSQSLLAE